MDTRGPPTTVHAEVTVVAIKFVFFILMCKRLLYFEVLFSIFFIPFIPNRADIGVL